MDVGDAWLEMGDNGEREVALREREPPDAARMHVAFLDGAWRVAEVGMNRTRVNGLPGDGALLLDGDVIERGNAAATFRASRARWGAARVGDAAVLHLHMGTPNVGLVIDDDGVGSCIDAKVVCVDTSGSAVERRHLGAGLVRIVDIEGPALTEVRARTARLLVAFDVASAFAIGRALLRSSLLESDVRLTFEGAIVVCGTPSRFAPAEGERRAASTTMAALELGASPAQNIERTVRLQRDGAVAWGPGLFSAEAQAHVLALANAAADHPQDVARVLDDAVAALGEPSAAQVRSVVRELFPRAAARHERLRDELALLGADAVLRPAVA